MITVRYPSIRPEICSRREAVPETYSNGDEENDLEKIRSKEIVNEPHF